MRSDRLKELRGRAERCEHIRSQHVLELLEHAEKLEASNAELLRWWSDVEARSADAHAVYQVEAHRRGDVRHPDAYADLSEATKEWDRVLVRWVLGTLRAVLAKGAT